MARPKLGEGETHRLHVKISDEELQRIDDWRFENRVQSRSEAVRRLCFVAMVALNGIDKLKKMAEDASAQALDDYEYVGGLERGLLQDAVEGNEHGFDYHQSKDMLIELTQRAYWQDQNTRYLNRIISGLSDALDVFADPQSFATAEKEADKKLLELNTYIGLQHDTWDTLGESHARSAIIRALSADERSHLEGLEDTADRIRYLDQKVKDYQDRRTRRHRRLISKVRKDDERIKQVVLNRIRTSAGERAEEDQ